MFAPCMFGRLFPLLPPQTLRKKNFEVVISQLQARKRYSHSHSHKRFVYLVVLLGSCIYCTRPLI
jgi:hypothetical protein